MLRRFFILASFSAILTSQAQAQSALGIAWVAVSGLAIAKLAGGRCCAAATVGSTVRLLVPESGPGIVTGVLTAIDADSFTVARGDASWRVARADSSRIQVMSRESKWAQGWAKGFGLGAGAGFLLGAFSGLGGWFVSGVEVVMIGTLAGAVAGSGAGAAIGMLIEGDRWQSIRRFSPALTVAPTVSAKGAMVGMRLAW